VIGNLLNQYRLDEVIGQGGMGVVYRALDTNLERVVAVKVLSSTLRDDPEFVARFRQEARIQAGLNHPNIATLFDFFVWNDMPVAVMELIKGETLRAMIDRTGPIPAHTALPIFVQALRGVAAGHRLGIIHRDLKPSNLMITGEGVVKITDFGIAKVRNNSGQTRVSTRVGSASYMAPEQILGRPVDEKTDIYIMGGTLYELLTGRPPFQGLSQFEIDSAHVRESPKLPTELVANIPPAAVAAVMKALAKEPSDRFATAEEFIQALPDLQGVPYVAPVNDDDVTRHRAPTAVAAEPTQTILRDDTPTQMRPLEAKSPNVRRLAITVAASGLLGLSVTGGLLLWARHQPHVTAAQPPEAAQTAPGSQPTAPGSQAAAPGSPATAPDLQATASRSRATAPDSQATAPGSQAIAPDLQATASRSRATAPDSQATAPGSQAIAPDLQATASRPSPPAPIHDLTGTWSGTYTDGAGKPRLRLQNLQLQQLTNGDVAGRFNLESGEQCTLEKSTYSADSRHLRLITHCHNPDHPKYLNVPLEFNNVDPTAKTIAGGRLDFHLADDIVVTLERAPGG
jgi:serine/threonine protein kinase